MSLSVDAERIIKIFSEYGHQSELKDFYNTVKSTRTDRLVFPTGTKRAKANS